MSGPPDADRYSRLELELNCPICRSTGLIPWQRLDRVLFCNRCAAIFRVEPQGLVQLDEPQTEKIHVQVRTNSSDWREDEAVLDRKPGGASWLRAAGRDFVLSRAARWGSSCAVVVLLLVTAWWASRTLDPPPQIELPASLEDRATLLAVALARRDVSLLMRMTEPVDYRPLRIWLAHSDDLPRAVAGQDEQIDCELVSTAKTTASGDRVEARVRLRLPPDGEEFVVNQSWVRRGESWYFRPIRLRTSARGGNWRGQPARGKM